MLNILGKIFGTQNERDMKKLRPGVEKINALESKYVAMSDQELAGQTVLFRERIQNGETVNQLLPEAFAVCREASKRVLGMRHFDTQLIGGMILHRGSISEMKTGEGKTLVATLPVYLNALEGKGVHVVTVNDYLARRDAEWMGRLYSFLGMTTGIVVHNQNDEEKHAAYRCDITYATNNELGFDYLRDNMKFEIADFAQRDLHYAIVDECDSILIDEARTPLIISGPAEESTEKYYMINQVIPGLEKEKHFTMEEKSKTVSLTEEGNQRCEELLKVDNIYDAQNIELMHHIYQGLKAHHLYHRDVDYMVKDGEVIIVDEFTGRLMDGRRWSDGLHQAVEAKEGLKVKNENQTLATITFQNYFRMYKKIAGMTGTADTEAVEFKKIYNLDVAVIPTNRPIQRSDYEDVVYKNQTVKFDAIVKDIKECSVKGQPVLVGTVSIERSEMISRHLTKNGVKHEVLNAKHHEREAEIVAQAGRKNAVTIATNMAGRGTDIVLGGNAEFMAKRTGLDQETPEYQEALLKFKAQCEAEKQEVIGAGGLYIIGTERHESRRIDNQLRGRSGRQGDPGASRFYLALDDDLMRKFNGERIQWIMGKLNIPDHEPITAGMVSRSIEGAQRKVEGHNFDIRKHLLDYDDVMNQQRQAIYSLRKKVLRGENVEEVTRDLLSEVVSHLLDTYADERQSTSSWNIEGLKIALNQQFGIELNLPSHTLSGQEVTDLVSTAVKEALAATEKRLQPFYTQVQRMLILQSIDQRWKEHLARMDQLREWINLRAYAQKDPLNEYKQEAFKAFAEMSISLKSEAIEKIFKIQLVAEPQFEAPEQPRMTTNQGEAAEAALDSLRPRERQKLSYSSGDEPESDGGGDSMTRNQRRKLERDKKRRK